MSIAAIIALLQSALLLLTIAQSAPNLPQSLRDNAIAVAQQAINAASSAVTTGATPSLTTTSTSTYTAPPILNSLQSLAGATTTSSAQQTTTPAYLQNPFVSSLKIDVLSNSNTSDRANIHLFDFKLSDTAVSPYSGTQYNNSGGEEIQVRRIRFTKQGSIGDGDISNIRLVNLDTGYVVQTLAQPTSGYIEFNVPINSLKPDYGVLVSWHSYGVIAEIANSASGNVSLSLSSAADVNAYDYRNDARAATITKLNTFPITGSSTHFDSVASGSTPTPTPSPTTITLWSNISPTSDKTEGTMLNVAGYSTATLQFSWSGATTTHTCQYAYTNYNGSQSQTYYSTFLYFPNSSCADTAVIPITSSWLKIDAWTPPAGALNASVLLQ